MLLNGGLLSNIAASEMPSMESNWIKQSLKENQDVLHIFIQIETY